VNDGRFHEQAQEQKPVPVHTGLTVSEALAEILCHDFQAMLSWEEQARSWDDTEGVHQMRVSSRRMRAALVGLPHGGAQDRQPTLER
jgi:CHAD domain-containing protein